MGADKLMFVTPTNPVQWGLAEGTGDAGQLSWAEGEHLLDNGSLTPVDRSYLQAALAATKGGVKRIHLVGPDDGALLRELYTRDGIGLLLYSDADYAATRVATLADVGGVLALLQPTAQPNLLVPLPRAHNNGKP